MRAAAKRNFIVQQGFQEPAPTTCPLQYSSLQFQPRIVLVWVVAAILFQSFWLFAVLGAVAWWSALFPVLNPFDELYNATIGSRPGAVRLRRAPAPRRFAQTMAGAFALACAWLIHAGAGLALYVVEAVMLAAVLALTIWGFCLGSFVFHLLGGRAKFARETLPWAG